MKPWREVAKPHADVLAGTFVQSDFAVDIMKVVDGSAPDEYRNPEAFYERTYVTEGMKQLLVTVAQRLNGRGGDPRKMSSRIRMCLSSSVWKRKRDTAKRNWNRG